jgi:hypothetical protein
MADDGQQKSPRTQADKDRSRQQSRAVTGKEAAKGVSGQPGRGQKSAPKGTSQKGASGPGRGNQTRTQAGKGQAGKGSGGGSRPVRSGRSTLSAPQRRSPTVLLTWGLVGLVLIIVIVLVVVKLTGTSTATSGPPSLPVPASIAAAVTKVPTSVYNTVGVSSPTVGVTSPKAVAGQPALILDGKPGVFYMGGEFCPYCAAERWAMITSFSRFGTLTGLGTMVSSSSDVYPSTQTFSFAKAHLTSPYITLETREYYSNLENSAGTGYTILQRLSKAQSALVNKYDTAKYAGLSTTKSGSIPFVDIGNKFLVAGASYSPAILQGLSRAQIASGLSTPKDPATRAIIASSNYISASICSSDGEKPASVCASKGVEAAAKAMGTSS